MNPITDRKDYDYIFSGGGCAALSLLMRLNASGGLHAKRVLVIDKAAKNENDRTWCFWQKGDGFFESIVYRSWEHLNIYGDDYAQTHALDPYRYKMIRGIDFYKHCLDTITDHPAVTILSGEVLETGNSDGQAFVTTASSRYTAKFVFNSILFEQPKPRPNQFYLLQHFKGFIIKTAVPCFDPKIGTLMDFRIDQVHGTSFVYVLPLSSTEALVEYTLFTATLLPQEEYDQAVHQYIKQVLKIDAYEVLSSEFGVIPMTNYNFPTHVGNVINIGTAGGQTKPSTGYTFSFIQKQAAAIAKQLAMGKFPVVARSIRDRKFNWYDSVLLNVLATGKVPGAFLFTELFRKNRITDVFRFLDNESTLVGDLKVIKVLPTRIFAAAAFRQATKPPGSTVPHT